jgi:hypothetical protein
MNPEPRTLNPEQELRALVREAVARQMTGDRPAPQARPPARDRRHPSHELLPLGRGSDGDGQCLIEPSVRCNHCGYCLSYGH